MPNQALGFAELLAGGLLVTAAITGAKLPDVITGKASGATNLGNPTGGDTNTPAADSSPSAAGGSYSNPFTGGHPVYGRTDQGVDVTLRPGDPIRAIGNARIIGRIDNWFAGQPLIWYQLLDGPQAGQYVYVAEQITPSVTTGQTVTAGQQIGTYAKSGTALEMGWATASGATLARSTTGYVEGQVTQAGQDFRNFLSNL